MPTNQFPLLLKRERQLRGWSQQDVASALEIARVTVARWESGEAIPALYLRGPLCELFGRRIEEFFPIDAIDSTITHPLTEPTPVNEINPVNAIQSASIPINNGAQADHQSETTESKNGLHAHEAVKDATDDTPDDLEASATREMHRLDAEKRNLEIQVKRYEMHSKRVEYTIDIANQIINVLDPFCDEVVRSLAIEELLTNSQQPDVQDEQDIPLPTFQSVRKALEAAKRRRTRFKHRQRMQDTSSQKDAIAVQQTEIDLVVPDSGIAVNQPVSLQRDDNLVALSTTGTPERLGSERLFHNPYGRLTPVLDPHEFVGRASLVRRIYAALADRQSISLTGPRRIGKSSLLRYLPTTEARRKFEEEVNLRELIFVFKDLGELYQRSSEDFFNSICTELIFQLRDLLMLQKPRKAGAADFSSLLDQINDRGFYPVLLLDEFEKITQNAEFDPDFFTFLRTQAALGKISYVTASRAPLYEMTYEMAQYEMTQRSIANSPFFNIFFNFPLGPLALEEARELIQVFAERAGLPFTEEETTWILRMAGRHPFFIQRVCYFLFEEKLFQSGAQINEGHVRMLAYEDLRPHFQDMWERLSEKEQQLLLDEAQQKGKHFRERPELSESDLFRQFVRHTNKAKVFRITPDELENALDKIDDPGALGATNFRLLNLVGQRIEKGTNPSAVERGIIIRTIFNEALERLRGSAVRNDSDPTLAAYNILYYRYFKYHLTQDQIAARLNMSVRQSFRQRVKAIEALMTVLFEMERTASSEV